jgi:hypothetical protein
LSIKFLYALNACLFRRLYADSTEEEYMQYAWRAVVVVEGAAGDRSMYPLN